MKQYVLYHNPRCSKSRAALELLETNGITPTVVHYLETPPNKQAFSQLLNALNLKARDLLRKGEDEYSALALDNEQLTEEELIETMIKYPKLIERPIFSIGEKAIIGRPPERVLELLK